MKQSLFIKGAEQIRIEDGKYYIGEEYGLVETDLEGVKEEMRKLKWCENSWSQELKDEYTNLRKRLNL